MKAYTVVKIVLDNARKEPAEDGVITKRRNQDWFLRVKNGLLNMEVKLDESCII